jgi:uroporphyrinogen III methyltransferase/synthase
MVFLVGAGPGDPGLVTLRAVECLARADVILYDYLVNPAVLEHASNSAELVPLGSRDGGRRLSPDEIMSLVLETARSGRTVLRLKGGDPSVFGRLADETEALRAAGIPFEIVPGITTGLAVGTYAEIPVTHHEVASAVALVTGRGRDGKDEPHLDYDALAVFPGTLVLYMAVEKAEVWSQALVSAGKPSDTPVAVVRWCSRAEQEIVRCTLGTVADVVRQRELRPPAVFVVGDAVGKAPDLSWFSARPLFGTRVLVPGSPRTSRKLRSGLTEQGAEVILSPTIRIAEPKDWAPVDAALDHIGDYDWLVFSSANGVDSLLRRLQDRGGDARSLGGVRLAAMGSGTAAALDGYGLRADLVPEEYVAESLAQAILAEPSEGKILLVRASRGRDALAVALSTGGAQVDQVVAYESTDVTAPDSGVAAALGSEDIGWITATSAATAHALARLYGPTLRSARFASIGPIASAALRELGYEPHVEASPHTTSGLVHAIVEASRSASAK